MPEPEENTETNEALAYLKGSLLSPRVAKFLAVGASGVLVNMGALYVFTEIAKIPYLIGSPIAIELSILSNFSINLIWTWRDRHDDGALWTKLLRYHVAVGITAFLGNYVILIALTEWLGIHYMVSNLVGIAIGTFFNYLANDLWTFKNRASATNEEK
jgi:dolichol-phosphate mannosyltransferase